MDKKIKNILIVVGSLLAIGAGFASKALGWWELPKKVEQVEKHIDETDRKLEKLVDVTTANVDAQRTLNVQQQAFYEQQIQFMRSKDENN